MYTQERKKSCPPFLFSLPNYTTIMPFFQLILDKRRSFFLEIKNCQTISFILQIWFFVLLLYFMLFIQNICFGFTDFIHWWKSGYPLWIKWITLCTTRFLRVFWHFLHVDKFINCAQLFFDDVSSFDILADFLCILSVFRFWENEHWQKNCKYNSHNSVFR